MVWMILSGRGKMKVRRFQGVKVHTNGNNKHCFLDTIGKRNKIIRLNKDYKKLPKLTKEEEKLYKDVW